MSINALLSLNNSRGFVYHLLDNLSYPPSLFILLIMIMIILIISIILIVHVNCYNIISLKPSSCRSLSSTSLLLYNNKLLETLSKQGLELKTASSENDMNQAAAFLAAQMYDADMPNGQRKELQRLEYVDLMNRYGSRTGKRKYPSALLLAIENEEIVSMVGIDCQLYDEQGKRFTPIKIVTKLYDDEPGKKVVQVLANLVVRRDKRKKGLGKLLLNASADTAKSFGYEELYLQVDSNNKAAQALYRKEGYKQIFTDPDATCVVSGQFGLKTEECINLGYVKKLSTSNGSPINLFSNIFSIFQSKS